MAYVMAVLYHLEGDEPVEAQEALIKTLPENALYVTNPLIAPTWGDEGLHFDIDVYHYTPDGYRKPMPSIIEVSMMMPSYSHAYIGERLGLTEDEVRKVLEANR